VVVRRILRAWRSPACVSEPRGQCQQIDVLPRLAAAGKHVRLGMLSALCCGRRPAAISAALGLLCRRLIQTEADHRLISANQTHALGPHDLLSCVRDRRDRLVSSGMVVPERQDAIVAGEDHFMP
jgi:hypothetical protein